jgi:hypothetical protein
MAPVLARRSFLAGLGVVICAPAIVRASSLMGVKPYALPTRWIEYGPISSVTITNGGSGYTSAPVVMYSDPLKYMRMHMAEHFRLYAGGQPH